MKDYKKNMLLALGCFLVIVVLNFFLPRLLPGDPVAYLTGFAEEDMTPAQVQQVMDESAVDYAPAPYEYADGKLTVKTELVTNDLAFIRIVK